MAAKSPWPYPTGDEIAIFKAEFLAAAMETKVNCALSTKRAIDVLATAQSCPDVSELLKTLPLTWVRELKYESGVEGKKKPFVMRVLHMIIDADRACLSSVFDFSALFLSPFLFVAVSIFPQDSCQSFEQQSETVKTGCLKFLIESLRRANLPVPALPNPALQDHLVTMAYADFTTSLKALYGSCRDVCVCVMFFICGPGRHAPQNSRSSKKKVSPPVQTLPVSENMAPACSLCNPTTC
jgi:hypothetical protein